MKRSKTTGQNGFTLVELMMVVAIIALLAVLAVPYYLKARTNAQVNVCIGHLRQIDEAAQQWALETRQRATVNVSEDVVANYLKLDATGHVPACPARGNYIYSSLDDSNGVVVCSLSTATPAHRVLFSDFPGGSGASGGSAASPTP